MSKSELIVMLTQNDFTIPNALEIFSRCKDTPAHYWGAKEQGIEKNELKSLFSAIKAAGKQTVLEVVAYDEENCLDGARLAVECGCDLLLGTMYFDSVHRFCREHNVRYMPFIGDVSERPSVLHGSLESMLNSADECVQKGVDGFDLLGYRYCGDCYQLSCDFVRKSHATVCLAGSINSFDRLKEVKQIAPDFFTIGGAFWDGSFGEDYVRAIAEVCRYMNH